FRPACAYRCISFRYAVKRNIVARLCRGLSRNNRPKIGTTCLFLLNVDPTVEIAGDYEWFAACSRTSNPGAKGRHLPRQPHTRMIIPAVRSPNNSRIMPAVCQERPQDAA